MKILDSHLYVTYIPELVAGWADKNIGVFLEKNEIVKNLPVSGQETLINFVLYKILVFFGGYDRVYKNEDGRNFMKAGYSSVIPNLTTHEVFSGLYEILRGNTDYISYPPNPLEFQKVCKGAPKVPPLENSKFLEHQVEIKIISNEEASKNIEKMKNIIHEMEKEKKREEEYKKQESQDRLSNALKQLRKRNEDYQDE